MADRLSELPKIIKGVVEPWACSLRSRSGTRAFSKPAEARKLVSACAVNIFEPAERGVAVNRDQEDECTLCGRCLEIGGDRLQIVKLYEKAGR